jgi:hypothetical protein
MQLMGQSSNVYPGRIQSDTVAVLVLVGGAEQHFTIPTGATVAVMACTGNFYVLVNGQTATVPSVTSVAFPSPNTIPELNPTVLNVTAGNLFSAIGPSNCNLIISFYKDSSKS